MRKLLIFLLFLAVPVFAETQGTINFTFHNATTGLYGYTVGLCNATSDCFDYKCFIDFDGSLGSGSGTSGGWCNATDVAKCFHNGDAYASGYYFCRTNTTYQQCLSGGTWSNQTSCSSGACVGGTSACSSSGSSGSGSGSASNITVDLNPSLILTSFPTDFEIVQGNVIQRTVIVKNSGNLTLYNVTLSVAGTNWYAVDPSITSTLPRNGSTTFNLTFTAPENAEVRSYALTVVIRTHNANASATRTLNMIVRPSEQTVQQAIIPDYAKYATLLAELKSNLSALQNAGANVEAAQSFLTQAENKLKQAQTAMDAKDYTTAAGFIDEARGLLNGAAARLQATVIPPFHIDTVVLIIILAAVGVSALIIYTMIPPKNQSRRLSDYFGRKKKR